MKTLDSNNKEGVVFGAVDMTVTLLGVIIGLSFSGEQKILLTAVLVTGIADSFANASGIFAISHIKNEKGEYKSALYCFLSTITTMGLIVVPFFIYTVSEATYISSCTALFVLVVCGYYATPRSAIKGYLVPLRFLITGVGVSIISYIIGLLIL